MGARALVEGRAYHRQGGIRLSAKDNPSVVAADVTSEEGDTAAATGAGLGLLPADSVQGRLKNLTEPHAAQPLPHGVLVSFADQVPQPELGWVHAQLAGDDIRVRLQGEEHRHRPGTAKIASRDSVRVDLKKLEGGMIHSVEPADLMPCGQSRVGLARPVGAAGVDHPQITGHDAAVSLQATAHGNHCGMGGVSCHQLLGIGHDYLHRPSRLLGQKIGNGQIRGVALAPELAAHVNYVDTDALFSHPYRLGQLSTDNEGVLGRRPYLDPAVGINRNHPGVRLNVPLVSTRDAKGVLQHQVRLAKALLHVTLAPG